MTTNTLAIFTFFVKSLDFWCVLLCSLIEVSESLMLLSSVSQVSFHLLQRQTNARNCIFINSFFFFSKNFVHFGLLLFLSFTQSVFGYTFIFLLILFIFLLIFVLFIFVAYVSNSRIINNFLFLVRFFIR